MRTEDSCIIQECLNGKSEVFGILVDKYKAGIYAFIYAELRDFRDAQDVTQEVFVEAYRGLHSLRRWESFGFWLYRIARNLCRKWIRTQSRRIDREFLEDQEPGALEDFSINSYRENQMSESLREALFLLPETYREVLVLYYFGDMNSVDIAKALGTSPTAVRHRLSRARARLKEEMVAMMATAFEGQRLQASFTFRIVEAVKRIKIHPMPRMAGLPWGLSFAVGIIITVLSLNPHMSITSDMAIPTGTPLPTKAKKLKTGEIPVDILKTSEISVIDSKQGDADGGKPQRDPQNALMMAPHAEGGTWTTKADMPTARWGLSTSAVCGKIYAIGGVNPESLDFGLPTVEEYDPKTDRWTKKADMPTPRMFLSTSVLDGKIYAIGGYGGGPIEREAVEEYDPVEDKWTKKADIPTPRMFFSTSVVNGKIYAIAGWKQGAVISALEEYDPVEDKWTKKPGVPVALCGLSTSVVKIVNERIYAIGGWDGETLFSTVEEYNPRTGKWMKKADMPTPRHLLSTNAMDGKIYAIGGSGEGVLELSTVEEYDPLKDKWAKKTDMRFARWGLSTSIVNGKIYAIGGSWGFPSEALSVVEEYDTGFVSEGKSVGPEERLPIKWGEVKK